VLPIKWSSRKRHRTSSRRRLRAGTDSTSVVIVNGVEEEPTIAFGLDLMLADEGGRSTPLPGGHAADYQFTYRPNWVLPGMTPPDQAGAPVLGFSRANLRPGDQSHAVIVALFGYKTTQWQDVHPGSVLPMYEGARVVGHGTVLWTQPTVWPLPESDKARFLSWLEAPQAGAQQ